VSLQLSTQPCSVFHRSLSSAPVVPSQHSGCGVDCTRTPRRRPFIRWRHATLTPAARRTTGQHQPPSSSTASLISRTGSHHLQNWCADDVRLFSRSMFEVLWWCVHYCTHHSCSFAITISVPRWPRRPTCTVHSVLLPQYPRVRTNNLEHKLLQDLWSTDTSEQFKRRLEGWLFECAYGKKLVW